MKKNFHWAWVFTMGKALKALQICTQFQWIFCLLHFLVRLYVLIKQKKVHKDNVQKCFDGKGEGGAELKDGGIMC